MTIKTFLRTVIDDRAVQWMGLRHLNFRGTEAAIGCEYPFTWFGLILRPERMKNETMFCTSGEFYTRVK